MVEDASPWYEPGTVSCYHPHTFGAILGELICRASGQPFAEFIHQEITGRRGIDFHFGLEPGHAARVAALWPAQHQPELTSPMATKVWAEHAATTEWIEPSNLGAVVPGSSGMTNGRALAQIGAVIALRGEVGGHRYLSSSMVDAAGREQSYAEDEFLGWARYGLGFGLDSAEFPAPTPTTLHWGGYGGSFVTMDPASGVACGFAQNQLMIGDAHGDDPRVRALWTALGEISRELG
jgi:CubicO group peptidase (beta-lactamase class C family)